MISVILSSNACTRSSNITTYVTNRSPRKAQASQDMKEIPFTSLGLTSQTYNVNELIDLGMATKETTK